MKTSTKNSGSLSIVIMGDEALVTEYSQLVTQHGYDILPARKLKTRSSAAALPSIALELTNLDSSTKKDNIHFLDKLLPATTAILTSSTTVSALEQASWVSMKHRLIGLSAIPTFLANATVEIAPTAHTLASAVDVARRFFASIGKEAVLVEDRVGMVLPRIVCQIVNEALFAVQQDVAVPQDIDAAMRLGMNFPAGPVEMGERIGFDQVAAVMEALHRDLGEERYRLCPLLKEIALTGKFWGGTAGEKGKPGK